MYGKAKSLYFLKKIKNGVKTAIEMQKRAYFEIF